MQNRRLRYDDDRGVKEPLNETDTVTGDGIQVRAEYNLHYFYRNEWKNLQRHI